MTPRHAYKMFIPEDESVPARIAKAMEGIKAVKLTPAKLRDAERAYRRDFPDRRANKLGEQRFPRQ